MFANQWQKLKTNLRLSVNRLKLMQKKKTELAQKARKEIAEYLQAGKYERAKIRVEHIIREDYLVEAMEIVEMYCDLLLARFGLIQQMKTLDEGLAEAISSLIWVAPRLQTDVQELKVIAEQLTAKYGKPYALACRDNAVGTVSPKLMHKMSIQAPPKILVERYLMEIAKSNDIDYQPDPQVMQAEAAVGMDAMLIDLTKGGGGGGAGGGSGGGGGGVDKLGFPEPPGFKDYPGQPLPPSAPALGAVGGATAPAGPKPFDYPPQKPSVPPVDGGFGGFDPTVDTPSGPANTYPSLDSREAKEHEANFGPRMNAPPPAADNLDFFLPPPYPGGPVAPSAGNPPRYPPGPSKPTPIPRTRASPAPPPANTDDDFFLNLPSVPSGLPDVPSHSPSRGEGGGGPAAPPPGPPPVGGNANPEDSIDFDDLTRRFEELKKRK